MRLYPPCSQKHGHLSTGQVGALVSGDLLRRSPPCEEPPQASEDLSRAGVVWEECELQPASESIGIG